MLALGREAAGRGVPAADAQADLEASRGLRSRARSRRGGTAHACRGGARRRRTSARPPPESVPRVPPAPRSASGDRVRASTRSTPVRRSTARSASASVSARRAVTAPCGRRVVDQQDPTQARVDQLRRADARAARAAPRPGRRWPGPRRSAVAEESPTKAAAPRTRRVGNVVVRDAARAGKRVGAQELRPVVPGDLARDRHVGVVVARHDRDRSGRADPVAATRARRRTPARRPRS